MRMFIFGVRLWSFTFCKREEKNKKSFPFLKYFYRLCNITIISCVRLRSVRFVQEINHKKIILFTERKREKEKERKSELERERESQKEKKWGRERKRKSELEREREKVR